MSSIVKTNTGFLSWNKKVETGLLPPCRIGRNVPAPVVLLLHTKSKETLRFIELVELASFEFQRRIPLKEDIGFVLCALEKIQAWLSPCDMSLFNNFSFYGGPEAVVKLLYAVRELYSSILEAEKANSISSAYRMSQVGANSGTVLSTSFKRVFIGTEWFEEEFHNDLLIRYLSLTLREIVKELEAAALFVLRASCLSLNGVVERLSLRKDLLIYLFNLTANKDRTSIYAIGILDELLAVRKETFPLADIPNLYSLLCDLSPAELAYVCRVLALLVFEPSQHQITEYPRIKNSKEYLDSRTPTVISSMKIVEQNNSILLGYPLLVQRLIVLASSPFKDCDISWIQRHSFVLPLEWFDIMLEKEVNIEWREYLVSLREYNTMITQQTTYMFEELPMEDGESKKSNIRTDELLRHLTSRARAIFDIVGKNRREILFVLSSLLSGERQVEAQEVCSSTGLSAAILFLFSGLDWTSAPSQSHSGLHGPDCECNPKNAEKVQFLRLLQNFIQREDDNRRLKRQFLSRKERVAIRNYMLKPAPRSTRRRRSFVLSANNSDRMITKESSSNSIHETFFLSSTWFSSGDIGGPLRRSDSTDTTSDVCQTLAKTSLGQTGNENTGSEDSEHIKFTSDLVHIGKSSSKYDISGYIGEGRLILHSNMDWDDAESPVSDSDESPNLMSDEELPKEKGVISLLVEMFSKRRIDDSSCYVSLASCLESFLEGATVAEQLLLARRGLLQCLVNDIITHDGTVFDCSNTLQASFDLLSQLCLFNRDIFFMLNAELRSSDGTRSIRFLRTLSENLVDSNFFLRAVVLSLHRFRMEDELHVSLLNEHHSVGSQVQSSYNFSNCLLFQFIQKNRVRLVYDLISVLREGEINQENISCITTAILMFLISDSNMELESLLSKLRLYDTVVGKKNNPILQNLKGLLSFWCDYYSVRGLAVIHLERSSFIPFTEWKRIVDVLLEIA
eukprot:jgi/Galph1/1095/GphlegSOOS_G5850.1